MFVFTSVLALLAAARSVSAVGCATHTFGSCEDRIVHWYDPDDGMICDPLDCGGGRAPPKSTNPCCGAYTGTEACVTSTSYLSCFVAAAAPTTSSASPGANDDFEQGAPLPTSTATTTNEEPTVDPTTLLEPTSSTPTIIGTPATSSGPVVTSSITTPATTRSTTASATTAGSNSSRTSSTQPTSTGGAGHSVQRDSLLALLGAAFGVALL